MIDSTGLGLHHVLAQTLVRVLGAGHGPANAVVLPHTIARRSRTAAIPAAAIARARRRRGDAPRDGLVARRPPPRRARRRPQPARARRSTPRGLPEAADAAAARPQLANTPPAADRDEILAIYEAAL